MKILFIFLTFFTSLSIPETTLLSLCNVEVNSVSVTGNVGFSTEGGLDLSDACVTFGGSASICDDDDDDDDDDELTTLRFTAQSGGCGDRDLLIEPTDPHTLQSIEDIYNLSALNAGNNIEKSIPLAYPNPSNGEFTLTNLDAGYEITLINSKTGEIIKSYKSNSQGDDLTIETNGLEAGSYYIKTINENSKTDFTQTIIIK